VGPRRINGQAFQGTFASICTVYGRRRTNSVDRHLPCPGRDASPAMRPRARALQWVSNIKMRRMLLACFWCRITLWSLSAEAALPVVRKEGSSRGGFLVWDGG
jgi:hypothetical protein